MLVNLERPVRSPNETTAVVREILRTTEAAGKFARLCCSKIMKDYPRVGSVSAGALWLQRARGATPAAVA